MKFVQLPWPKRTQSSWIRPRSSWLPRFSALLLLSSTLSLGMGSRVGQAQVSTYCHLSADAIAQKEALLQASLKGDRNAATRYQALVSQHAAQLEQCRSRTWPQNQALWIRLYPCDLQPGVLDRIMDQAVSRGYNEIYVEAFYNGQVLLPAAENRTPWPSVVRTPGAENADLLAQAIQKGRERGLKVYAWLFTMNFGYTYAQRPDRQSVLARNGRNQTTLDVLSDTDKYGEIAGVSSEEAFADPYSNQAKVDYYQMVQAIAKRRPDGMLFDYVRYHRGLGAESVASRVQDLWIYGESAQQALLGRAQNQKGAEAIRRFLRQGYITAGDISAIDRLYPQEREPLWEGRNPPIVADQKALPPAAQRQPLLQQELWYLSVAHAFQGILDFVATATLPAQRQGIPTGAVFFPDGNQVIGQGFDSRMQPWHRFPSSMEFHPMSYGVCGNTSCITSLVQRVVDQAPPGAQIKPVLAGSWGSNFGNRPSLENQMQAIQQIAPQIRSISHFAYSWQFPDSDRDRKSCRAQ